MENPLLRQLTRGPVAFLLIVGFAPQCTGSADVPADPAEDASDPIETAGQITTPVVVQNVTDATLQWALSGTGSRIMAGPAHEYTVSAIGPQSGVTGCTSGAMVLTHGGTQSMVRSTLPCLGTSCSSPNFQSGPSPQPSPGASVATTPCASPPPNTPPTEPGPVPEFQIVATDAETIRVGQTSLLHLATGRHNRIVAGPSGGTEWNGCRQYGGNAVVPSDAVPPFIPRAYWTDFYRRSTNCGESWGGYTEMQWTDPPNNPAWNFDMPHLYVDPYNKSPSGNYYVYIFGQVALRAKGVIESGDAGVTWGNRRYIGDSLPTPAPAGSIPTKNDGWSVGGNMTSTSDGTQFFAGCYWGKVRLFYSYDRWATYSIQELTWDGNPPACSVLNNAEWPAGAEQGNVGPYAVAISRLAYSNVYPKHARVRVAYPIVFGAPYRQGYNVLEVGVKRKGVSGSVAPYQTQIVELQSPGTASIVEAGFVEPDPFDTPRGGPLRSELPDTAILWTMEGRHTEPQSLQVRYSVWQGARTYSMPRDLSLNSWVYSTCCDAKCSPGAVCRRWNGDYNRSGAYFYDRDAKRYGYLLVWPQGEQAAPTLSQRVEPHFNIVRIRPGINPATVTVVEKLNFGTLASGPGVASQGPSKLDVFWRDTAGNLIQKSRTASGWTSGTTSRGKPSGGFTGDPAAASWGTNRLDVFVRGTGSALWQWWWDGTPRGWVGIAHSGTVASSPAVTDAGTGVLYLFTRSASGTIQYLKYTNSTAWTSVWKDLGTTPGGAATGDPVAVNDGSVVHVFTRAANNQVYQKWSPDGGTTWHGWTALGGNIGTSPAVASWGAGRVDLFGLLNGMTIPSLMHRGFESGWQADWQDLMTVTSTVSWVGNPEAISTKALEVDVFARSSDNRLWHLVSGSPP